MFDGLRPTGRRLWLWDRGWGHTISGMLPRRRRRRIACQRADSIPFPLSAPSLSDRRMMRMVSPGGWLKLKPQSVLLAVMGNGAADGKGLIGLSGCRQIRLSGMIARPSTSSKRMVPLSRISLFLVVRACPALVRYSLTCAIHSSRSSTSGVPPFSN